MQQNRLVVPLASAFLTLADAHNPPHPWGNDSGPHTFLGTVKKWGGSYWLANSTEKVAARLDNTPLASRFVNQRVRVVGTIHLDNNYIETESIAPIH